jgi:NitT/TauT family transport system substrate-binding protein
MASKRWMRLIPHALALVLIGGTLPAIVAGCGEKPAAPSAGGRPKVKVAYLGLTCEAGMFVAQEKGFFRDEGIDVEFVKTDWDGLRDGLGLGRFDANYTLVMYVLKPIEQGLDVKITGGIHKGCLRVHAAESSGINTVADLKGKKIGIPTMGSPPFLFASRALAAAGLDPQKDVEWVVVAPDVSGLAISNGTVDAIADSEPIGSILSKQNKVRTIADQAADAPYKDEYCCAVVVNGDFAKRDPKSAAAVTRALMRGARWVAENPVAAADLSVEKKYVASSADLNAHAISALNYLPAVVACRDSVGSAAAEMKQAGLLNPSTDPAGLARQAWLDLDGVTDEWVKGLAVEKVAARPLPDLSAETLAALLWDSDAMCCSGEVREYADIVAARTER